MRQNVRAGLVAGAVAVTAAACGTSANASGTAGGSSGGAHKVSIVSPKPGADVKAPLTVKFATSVPIGPTDTGKDHVHVFIDGKSNEYTVVTSSPYTIKNLPMGKHTIDVTLQHADHSPDGASAQVPVNVTAGGTSTSGGSGGSGSSGGSGGYGY